MKVKMRKRQLKDMGPADCRCCSRLSWKECRLDRQILKEALEETMVAQPDGWRRELS